MTEAVAVSWALVFVVTLALVYAFASGYQNAATLIGPIVSTGVLRPASAVAWVALFTALGGVSYGLQVAATLAFDLLAADPVPFPVLAVALVAALLWLGLMRAARLPASASHALIGGLVGAALAQGAAIALPGFAAIVAALLLAPVVAFGLSILLMIGLAWALRRARPSRVDRWIRPGQIVGCALTALGHGGNDAQKTVAMIWLAVVTASATGLTAGTLPTWVPAAAAMSLALGVAAGGSRLMLGGGEKITRLRPAEGWAAESASGLTLAAACAAGAPVSSTHVVTGALLGVHATRRDRRPGRQALATLVWASLLGAPSAAILASSLSILWVEFR